MPGLVRKFVIFAGVDGLVLQPLAPKEKRGPVLPVRICYGTSSIAPVLKDDVDGQAATKKFEAFGIVGTLIAEM